MNTQHLFRSLRTATLLGIMAIVAAACGTPTPATSTAAPSAASAAPRQGGSVRVGLSSDIASLDPMAFTIIWEAEIGHQIFDPLVAFDSQEPRYKPALSESWQVSADALTYTFKLRSGVRFHDGTAFDAVAAKANFDRLLGAPASAVKAADAFTIKGALDSATTSDNTTLILKLKAPSPALLTSLGQFFMSSPTAISKYGTEYGQHPVGTGPFRLKQWVPKDRLVLERNPDYAWARGGSAHQGPAYLDDLTYRIMSDPPARVIALESGDVDVITDVPPQDSGRVGKDDRYRTYLGSSPGLPLVLHLNVNRGPTADARVRSAIQAALDRNALIGTAVFGQRQPALGLLSSSTVCYKDLSSEIPAPNAAAAKSQLDQAGWIAGANGIRSKDGAKLAFELVVFPPYANLATAIQGQLREVGIDLTPRVMEIPAAVPLLTAGTAGSSLVAGIIADPSVLNQRFGSKTIGTGLGTGSIIPDARNDELLGLAAKELDQAKRCALYTEFQQRFLRSGAVYPIYEMGFQVAAQAKVRGIRLEPLGLASPLFYDVHVASSN